MKKFFVLLSCLAALCLGHLRAQTPAGDVPRIDVQKFTLPNGLEVILSEDHKLPMVAVNLWYHVGPVNEVEGRTGFAHLFEHMMFQGSKHTGSDTHFKLLQGAGATGVNGTTDFDRTNYFETVPSNQLELALWIESDRMGYLLDTLDQAQLSNQQDVVRNERRQTTENQPYGIVDEAVIHLLFPREHPYYASVIGSHADIQAAKLEDVKQFFKLYYRPNNATIAIVGDIDKGATRKLVEKYFGTFKRGAPLPRVTVQTPPLTSERRAVIQDRVELPRVYITWLTPQAFKPGDAEADIAGMILGEGRPSRLYKKLVYEKQIAQSVRASQYSLQLASMFQIEATASPGHTAAEVEAAVQDELNRFRSEGPTTEEVERARTIMETGVVRRLQRAGGVANQLNFYNHYLGTPDYIAQDLSRHRSVTPESVRRFAQQWLKDNARVVVYGVPGTKQLQPDLPAPQTPKTPPGTGTESVNADEPWRATQPNAPPAAAVRLPAPQTFLLANGLTVMLAEQPSLPFVAARLVVGTGSSATPLDRPGLPDFAVAMLNQGTATRSAPQLAEDAERLGLTLNVSSSMDESAVAASSLSRNFPAALRLIADVVLHPSFPSEEVERQRALRLANLVRQQSNPTTVATNELSASLYGSSHPYGFSELGNSASIRKITPDELRAFWQRNFVPSNAALVVAGATTMPELRRLAEEVFGAWSGARPSVAQLGAPAPTASKLVIVDRPGSPQTQLRVGLIGAARSSPDYIALRVMNQILGAGAASRLFVNLREQHGYTYGAYSQFAFLRDAGPFSAGAGVRTDVTAPAVQEVLKEIGRMSATTVTADELSLAKDSITQSLPASFATDENTVADLSSLFVYRLPLDYYSTLGSRIQRVSAEDVQAVARKYLIPEHLVVVAVGDKAKIGAALEAQLGPAELRDPGK